MVVTAVTLVGTGSETVSTLLTGMVYFLGTNLNILNRLECEIRDTFTSYDDITLPNLNKLPYLTACLQETMRLYPPVVGLLWRVPPAGGARVMGEYIPEGVSFSIEGVPIQDLFQSS
jgi:cytochrome P450